MQLSMNWQRGCIEGLFLGGTQRLAQEYPIFTARLRNAEGQSADVSAWDGHYTDGSFVDIPCTKGVRVSMQEIGGKVFWKIKVTPEAGWAVEWVDFPNICLPQLVAEDPEQGGKILYPYNEGALVDSMVRREQSYFPSREICYPSTGSMPVFPNMICSQMLGYLWEDCGLYIGLHDPDRGLKGIDFLQTEHGIRLCTRLFSGCDISEVFSTDYDIVWEETDGNWESMCELYRAWFSSALPPRAVKLTENPNIPVWYCDSPLVVSYPVRGRFDTDTMTPNALYPYTNALPLLDEIKERTNAKLLVLLMHWEGTAPWAPPYVWPPFGDPENFEAFLTQLHAQGDLLGVYCSGFGYSIRSKLTEFGMEAEYQRRGLVRAMCAGPDGKVLPSKICTEQRQGYDICPASDLGRQILEEAYRPLLESGLDYFQILDQNHGGGQYLCYSRDHGHPPMPGKWMTQNMQQLLTSWNETGKHMLLGCESAAAEPFVGNLLLSDNRFELNYRIGRPVPLYAYIYHEYLRNFMGNQVCCPLPPESDSLCYRLAYSFCIGDCMTLVLDPEGNFLSAWGEPPEAPRANRDRVLTLIANLTDFYQKIGKPWLSCGRMVSSLPIKCGTVTFGDNELPSVHCSAWECGEGKVHILVNPAPESQTVFLDGKAYEIPPLNAVAI